LGKSGQKKPLVLYFECRVQKQTQGDFTTPVASHHQNNQQTGDKPLPFQSLPKQQPERTGDIHMNDSIITLESCQDTTVFEILSDKSATGRERPWKEKKLATSKLEKLYQQINYRKADRLKNCADMLTFTLLPDGSKKLQSMNSCRVRLCPMCAWRRGLKIYSHITKILNAMNATGNYAYIFLTLTIENCPDIALIDTLNKMLKSLHRMLKHDVFKYAVKGWYRSLEITHNVNPKSKDFDTYHPHFHFILAVDPSYFTSRHYLSQNEWAKLWQTALHTPYTPIVDVRRVRNCTSKAVAEVAKYTVKETDYIIPTNWNLSIQSVKILDKALERRRLVAYGGIMKEWHKKLNLDDEIDGNLVDTDLDNVDIETTSITQIFYWIPGYKEYISFL